MTLQNIIDSRHLTGPEIDKRKQYLEQYKEYDALFWIYDKTGHILLHCVVDFSAIESLVKDIDGPQIFCSSKKRQQAWRIL